ncbi:MAG: hypothetical protein LBU86_05745, partial [Oscillospiraceae bacterium]|nr:hypothetical protein [Oscillospiraceae bacterium]
MGYPKQVYDRAWEELARRERACREEALARKEEIHRLIPEIKEIAREMAIQGALVAKAAISDPAGAQRKIRELSERNLACQRRREELLAAAGYPADYLAERSVCPICKDAGYVGPRMCGCMEALLRKEAAAFLGRFSPAQECSFGSFVPELYPETPDDSGVSPRARMKEVLAFCK